MLKCWTVHLNDTLFLMMEKDIKMGERDCNKNRKAISLFSGAMEFRYRSINGRNRVLLGKILIKTV